MEDSEIVEALDGNDLPKSVNSLKFAASRSIEIAAMTDSILDTKATKLIFQCLPIHMRRRVMSHNSKRMPIKLRNAHLEQISKNGVAAIHKRPSRKFRRRPANLLEEYTRRQKRNIWLETHIWHAKRFHMVERWGHRLANAPCDKAFRPCYRASSAHCLLQDISYYKPIQILGPDSSIKNLFSRLTDSRCGLSVCAKAYMSGKREGSIHLYETDSYPYNYIGKVNFLWVNSESNLTNTLWLFAHPSQAKQVESILSTLLDNNQQYCENIPEKRRKIEDNLTDDVKINLNASFNRFRLTGPNSHAILAKSLKCVKDTENIKSDHWISLKSERSNGNLYLNEKHEYWQRISIVQSPSQISPHVIIGLIVKDPRLSRPSKRTKAKSSNNEQLSPDSLTNLPNNLANSPLWDTSIHEIIKKNIMTNTQFINHITKTYLVPGELNEDDEALQRVPVVLIQRPGSQNSGYKKIGYNSGWDIIVPSGYGLAFWQTFIMYGGRPGGLRESENVAFEMGEIYLPPDSKTGKEEEKRIEIVLKEQFFKLPPSKRVNYIKLGINSPFICPWKILLNDWGNHSIDDFFVLRDKQMLIDIQECFNKRLKQMPVTINDDACLVAIYLQVVGKGSLKNNSIICLPHSGDVTSIDTVFECHHEDPNEVLRKSKRVEHKKLLKQLKRKRSKSKKKGVAVTQKQKRKCKLEPSEYTRTMRELWVPSNIRNVRHSSSREVIGYLPKAAYSFTESKSCGVGYIVYNALKLLIKKGLNQVLVRTTSSRKYRIANLQIIKM